MMIYAYTPLTLRLMRAPRASITSRCARHIYTMRAAPQRTHALIDFTRRRRPRRMPHAAARRVSARADDDAAHAPHFLLSMRAACFNMRKTSASAIYATQQHSACMRRIRAHTAWHVAAYFTKEHAQRVDCLRRYHYHHGAARAHVTRARRAACAPRTTPCASRR